MRFLTRLRRPYLFSRKRKDRGEKSAWTRLVHAASEFWWEPMFQASFHSIVTLRVSAARRLIRGVSDLQLVALERLPSIEGSAEILIGATFLRGSITSPPHFVRHLPLTRGGLWGAHSKAPLVKGSWRGAPEGLARRSGLASPMRGSCRRRRLMRWTAPRRSKCPHLIRHGSAVPPSPHRGRQGFGWLLTAFPVPAGPGLWWAGPRC